MKMAHDERWTPLDFQPVEIPPTREQIDVALNLCVGLLNGMCGLVWHAEITAGLCEPTRDGLSERVRLTEVQLTTTLPYWVESTQSGLDALRSKIQQADDGVRRWGRFFDRFSGSVQMLGGKPYSNTAIAILGAIDVFLSRMVEPGELLQRLSPTWGINSTTVPTIRDLSRRISRVGTELLGTDYKSVYSALVARLRVEMGKAVDATLAMSPTPGPLRTPVYSGEEQQILDTLRRCDKRMKQEDLLATAGLKISGTNKALLSQMVQRELIDNRRSSQLGGRGKGYGLPEWDRPL